MSGCVLYRPNNLSPRPLHNAAARSGDPSARPHTAGSAAAAAAVASASASAAAAAAVATDCCATCFGLCSD